MAKEGKITVKHYLNKQLKGKKYSREHNYYEVGRFPVYVQIGIRGKTNKFRSNYHNCLRDYLPIAITADEFKRVEFKRLFDEDERLIRRLLKYIYPPERQNIDITIFPRAYEISTNNIHHRISNQLCEILKSRLNGISPYFTLVINWEMSFWFIWQSILEITQNHENHMYLSALEDLAYFYRKSSIYLESGGNRTIQLLDWTLDNHKDLFPTEIMKNCDPSIKDKVQKILDGIMLSIEGVELQINSLKNITA